MHPPWNRCSRAAFHACTELDSACPLWKSSSGDLARKAGLEGRASYLPTALDVLDLAILLTPLQQPLPACHLGHLHADGNC